MIIPTVGQVRGYLRAHPGSTCAVIASSLGAPTVLVSRIMRELSAAGKARKVGNTKATQWFLARPTKQV